MISNILHMISLLVCCVLTDIQGAEQGNGALSDRVSKQQVELTQFLSEETLRIDSDSSFDALKVATKVMFTVHPQKNSRPTILQLMSIVFPEERKPIGWQQLYGAVVHKLLPLNDTERRNLVVGWTHGEKLRTEFVERYMGMYALLPGLYSYVYKQTTTDKSRESVEKLYHRTMKDVDQKCEVIKQQVQAYKEFYTGLPSQFESVKAPLITSITQQLDQLAKPVRIPLPLAMIAEVADIARQVKLSDSMPGYFGTHDDVIRDDTIGILCGLSGSTWQEKKWGEIALSILGLLQKKEAFNSKEKQSLQVWTVEQVERNDMKLCALKSLQSGLSALYLYAQLQPGDARMVDFYVHAEREIVAMGQEVKSYMDQTQKVVTFVEQLP